MNAQRYYQNVIGQLKNCFQFSNYVVVAGEELKAEGADPSFPAFAVPINELDHFTLERGLQVHIPIIGSHSRSVLMPLDFEIFLEGENHSLYTDKKAQKRLFQQVLPVSRYLEEFFQSRGLPYLLDYTPSGGHILFQNVLGMRATQELRNIGYLEADLIKACQYKDHNNIRRRDGVSLDSASVFSGLGKIAEYIALRTMETFKDNEAEGKLPIIISDALPHCINMDNTWSEGSPFMRGIRSPFSLHKKNHETYGMLHQPPLVDVIGTYFDGQQVIDEPNIDYIVDCMWDLEQAAKHSQQFSGYIPCSNETLIDLIREYKGSDLYKFHEDFDNTPDCLPGQALEYAKRERNVPDWARNILFNPNPAALQPKNLIGFVNDFLISAKWKPKHIGNILRDLYQNPYFGWTQDFFLYPAEEKANYWARVYSAVSLWRNGRLFV